MFKYKSVFWINFHALAHHVPANCSYVRAADYKEAQAGTAHISKVHLARGRKSYDSENIRLIKINFDLSISVNLQRARDVITEGLKELEFPAKIFINIHGDEENNCFYQDYQREDKTVATTRITPEQMAEMFINGLPADRHKELTFHFLACDCKQMVEDFMNTISRKGFSNCFAVYYYGSSVVQARRVSLEQMPRQDSYEVVDFSSTDRITESKKLAHRERFPFVKSNKGVCFISGGRARHEDYLEFVREYSKTLPPSERKNLFAYSYENDIELYINVLYALQALFWGIAEPLQSAPEWRQIDLLQFASETVNLFHEQCYDYIYSTAEANMVVHNLLLLIEQTINSVDVPSPDFAGIIESYQDFKSFTYQLTVLVQDKCPVARSGFEIRHMLTPQQFISHSIKGEKLLI